MPKESPPRFKCFDEPHDELKDLEHYGVLGMKWGIRKQRKPTRKVARLAAKKMPDEQLRMKINRMNLENQYVDLVVGKKQGQNFVANTLKKSAGIILAGYSTKYMKKGIEFLANYLIDEDIMEVIKK